MRGLVIFIILVIAVFAPVFRYPSIHENTILIENESVKEVNFEHECGQTYIVNLSTKKYHIPDCRYATSKDENNLCSFNDEEFLVKHGYQGCKKCIK